MLPRHHVLPLLIVDECGPRVNELATAQVGDLDEHRKAIRVRWTVEKNDRYRHLELPDDLFDALLATLPPREDRDLEAPLFPDLTDARLRTAITKACKATGTPHFSPHGLRRRRGSLHYKRTGSLAEVAELLGDSKRVAADHYVYALTDYREVDRDRTGVSDGSVVTGRAGPVPDGSQEEAVLQGGANPPAAIRIRLVEREPHGLSQAVCAIRVHRASRCWPRCGPRERANLGPDRRRIASWPDRPSSTSSGASPPRSTRTAQARATRRR